MEARKWRGSDGTGMGTRECGGDGYEGERVSEGGKERERQAQSEDEPQNDSDENESENEHERSPKSGWYARNGPTYSLFAPSFRTLSHITQHTHSTQSNLNHTSIIHFTSHTSYSRTLLLSTIVFTRGLRPSRFRRKEIACI